MKGTRKFKVVLENREYEVEVESLEEGSLEDIAPTRESIGLPIVVGGTEFNPIVEEVTEAAKEVVRPVSPTPIPRAPAITVEGKPVKAPMPGVVTKVLVKAGDKVKVRDTLLLLEAMKMENAIESPVAGIVKSVNVKPGQTVQRDQVLVVVG